MAHTSQSLKLQRLNELELNICAHQGMECQTIWLEEYLDLGLEFAYNKPLSWQEGWLQRLFRTLLAAIHNPAASPSWRQKCADYLYLPFFALSQLYQGQACQNCKLCELLRQYHGVEFRSAKSCASSTAASKGALSISSKRLSS